MLLKQTPLPWGCGDLCPFSQVRPVTGVHRRGGTGYWSGMVSPTLVLACQLWVTDCQVGQCLYPLSAESRRGQCSMGISILKFYTVYNTHHHYHVLCSRTPSMFISFIFFCVCCGRYDKFCEESSTMAKGVTVW